METIHARFSHAAGTEVCPTGPVPPGADQDGDAVADASIAKAGYRRQFARTLSRFESFAVAFSFISGTCAVVATTRPYPCCW
jgi:hypothetical protein